MGDAGIFDERLDAWRDWQESPWGRLRYAVVRHTLTRVCAEIGEPARRIS